MSQNAETAAPTTTSWDDAHLVRACLTHIVRDVPETLGIAPLTARLAMEDASEVWAELLQDSSALGQRAREVKTEAVMREADRAGVRFVIPGDAEWPAQLDDLFSDVPLGLWVQGPAFLAEAAGRSVTVTGSRVCSSEASQFIGVLGEQLSEANVTVVTGLALGVDLAAARQAVEHDEAVVLVTAGGLLAPPLSDGLCAVRDYAAKRGALVSERPVNWHPVKSDYSDRARLLAALSPLMVAVDPATAGSSGAAVDWARSLAREVVVHKAQPGAGNSAEVAASIVAAAIELAPGSGPAGGAHR